MSFTRIIATGTYVGNGGTQSISIGWKPAVIWIVSTASQSSSKSWSIKIDTMPGDDFQFNTGNSGHETANGVTITADGFDLGSDTMINRSGVDHYYIAFRSGSAVDTGVYTGDGIDGRLIATGRKPALVTLCESTGSQSTTWKIGSMPGRLSLTFTASMVSRNAVGVVSGGFDLSVGGSLDVNVLDETYYWMALYESDGSTRQLELGTYVGVGGAGPPFPAHNIVTGLQPQFFMSTSQRLGGPGTINEWVFVATPYASPNLTSSFVVGHFIEQEGGNDSNRISLVSNGVDVYGSFNSVGDEYQYVAGYF